LREVPRAVPVDAERLDASRWPRRPVRQVGWRSAPGRRGRLAVPGVPRVKAPTLRRRFVVGALGAFAVFGASAGLVGCGDDGSGPDSADSCQELVDEAADVARSLAEEFAGATVESLDPGTPDDPFPQLSEPFVPFR